MSFAPSRDLSHRDFAPPPDAKESVRKKSNKNKLMMKKMIYIYICNIDVNVATSIWVRSLAIHPFHLLPESLSPSFCALLRNPSNRLQFSAGDFELCGLILVKRSRADWSLQESVSRSLSLVGSGLSEPLCFRRVSSILTWIGVFGGSLFPIRWRSVDYRSDRTDIGKDAPDRRLEDEIRSSLLTVDLRARVDVKRQGRLIGLDCCCLLEEES